MYHNAFRFVLFAMDCLGYTGSFLVQFEPYSSFSNSVKKVNGSLIGIALILQITLRRMVIFTILILLIHEHRMFLHLLVSFLISLSSGLVVLLKGSFTSL